MWQLDKKAKPKCRILRPNLRMSVLIFLGVGLKAGLLNELKINLLEKNI